MCGAGCFPPAFRIFSPFVFSRAWGNPRALWRPLATDWGEKPQKKRIMVDGRGGITLAVCVEGALLFSKFYKK